MNIIDLIFHLDKYLENVIIFFGFWIYVFLFLIILAETGFVFTPFLPGDSLLFIAGALSAVDKINLILIIIIFCIAAISGDTINYHIGKSFGNYLIKKKNNDIFIKNLNKTNIFYKKYGGETIIIARFIPILRTFAPFIAGIGIMEYKKFIIYNIIGAILWVISIVFIGYFFGNIQFIKNNYSFVIILIILISILPSFVAYIIKTKK